MTSLGFVSGVCSVGTAKRTHRMVSVLLLCLTLSSTHLYAWNDLGHFVAAFIGYEQMTVPVWARANAH
jgi:hypothetical protein